MSPDLFNLYSEVILRNLDGSEGLKANGENLNNLRYADDTSLLAGSEEDLQRLLNIVVEESEKLGLSLNVKKTECMVVSKKKNNPECKLFSKGEQIRQVQKFKYLGYTLTSDVRQPPDFPPQQPLPQQHLPSPRLPLELGVPSKPADSTNMVLA
ncbi:hypothetical protein RRG08_015488 [Elysia crispata]|uniref:Reverse transcriptase domain-containing protein n=1 Tax=Elysia crispata TaxID=231223 RepID=A0AAE1DRZ6_9GAST|nr:hypothetical protein RRG08_015488 [Elysia crispata]